LNQEQSNCVVPLAHALNQFMEVLSIPGVVRITRLYEQKICHVSLLPAWSAKKSGLADALPLRRAGRNGRRVIVRRMGRALPVI
jgi:hypothetical protein